MSTLSLLFFAIDYALSFQEGSVQHGCMSKRRRPSRSPLHRLSGGRNDVFGLRVYHRLSSLWAF